MPGMTALEAELEAVWRKYHVRAQMARFASGWLAAFLWGMAHGFGDWTTVLPLAGSAVWTAAMEMWPQVPWKLIRARLRAVPPPGQVS